MKTYHLLLSITLSLGLVACGQDKSAESTAPAMAENQAAAGSAGTSAAIEEGASADEIYVAKCLSCHGETAEGVADNPTLVGLPKAEVESRLKDYRDGKQRGPKTAIMAAVAKPLTDEQIAALALYLGE